MEGNETSAAVQALLRRYGLLQHHEQLHALGATAPLHLFALTPEDLKELDAPPLTEGCERAFAALLAAANVPAPIKHASFLVIRLWRLILVH